MIRVAYREPYRWDALKAAAKFRIANLEKRAQRWRPFRAYAAVILWESL